MAQVEFQNNISENFMFKRLNMIKIYKDVDFLEHKLPSAGIK